MSHALSSPRLGWAVLALAALAAGCSSPAAPDATPRVVSVSRGFEIPGFGWEMTISSDLSVVDLNHRYTEPDVVCVARISSAQWIELQTEVEAAHFFELAGSYPYENPDARVPYFMRVARTDALKTIYVGAGVPEALGRLDTHLDSLRKSAEWIARDGTAASQSFCTNRWWLKDTA